MKIEKVNENQIRCTLTKEDLASRELKISELAYGTDKAKNLFRDMMQQANFELGFEANDIPLMIEAIPMNAECIVLIITKVEDPEELDTRFSRFAPSIHEDEDEDDYDADQDRDEVMDLFRKIQLSDNADTGGTAEATGEAQTAVSETAGEKLLIRLFQFDSLHTVLQLAFHASDKYNGTSALYRNLQNDKYLLLLTHSSKDAVIFNRFCNLASEYGIFKKVHSFTPAYLAEHCRVVIPTDAVAKLGQVGRS